MRWQSAYIIKKMEGKDFSEIVAVSRRTWFLLGEDPEPIDFAKVPGMVEKFLRGFDPDEDVLVLAGPAALCAMAFQWLARRYVHVHVAIFKDGRYEYFKVDTYYHHELSAQKLEEAS